VQVPLRGRRQHQDLVQPERKRLFFDRSVSSAINGVHEQIAILGLVSRLLGAVISYHEDQINENHAGPECIPGFEDAVQRLKTLLDIRVIEKTQQELGTLLPSSPPMRSMFEAGNGGLELRSDNTRRTDYLIWLGKDLWTVRDLAPPELLATELIRVVQQDKT
jgi:hypothetical protein